MRRRIVTYVFFAVILQSIVLSSMFSAQTLPSREASSATSAIKSSAGSIVGKVTDLTGAVIPGAHVQALQSTGAHYEVATGSDGGYQFANLPAGNYCMAAAAQGFVDFVNDSAVHVSDRQASTLNMSLTIAQCTEVVCVTGGAPFPSSRVSGLALELQLDRELVTASSGLWLTATLSNTTKEPIDVEDGLSPKFGYVVQFFAHCGCSGQRLPPDAGATRFVRIPPGGKLTHSIDLGAMLAQMPHGAYAIYVQHATVPNITNGGRTVAEASVIGSFVTVKLVSSELAESCK